MAKLYYIYAYLNKADGRKRKGMDVQNGGEVRLLRKLQKQGTISGLQTAKVGSEKQQHQWMRVKTFEVPTFMKSLKK